MLTHALRQPPGWLILGVRQKKTMNHIIILVSVFALAAAACAADRDSVGGREILKLKPGTYIVGVGNGGPQLEVGVSQDGFTVTELTQAGMPRFVVLSSGEKIEYLFTTIKDGNEIYLIDKDGDGIPELRLTVLRDKDGKSTGVRRETVKVTFEEKK
jgi:hypothetical protein